MLAIAPHATTKAGIPAKPKVLPPARAFAKQARAVGPTFARVGGKQLRGGQRFALPKEFRRSAPGKDLSPVSSFQSQANSVLGDRVISGARLLEVFGNLSSSDAAHQHQPLAIDLNPW